MIHFFLLFFLNFKTNTCQISAFGKNFIFEWKLTIVLFFFFNIFLWSWKIWVMTSISTRELTNDFLVDCDATTDLFCMYAVCCTSHVVYFLQSFLRTTIIKSISPTIQYWLHVVLPYKKASTGTLLYSIFSFSAQEASEKPSVLSWECNLTDTAMNYVHNQIIEASMEGSATTCTPKQSFVLHRHNLCICINKCYLRYLKWLHATEMEQAERSAELWTEVFEEFQHSLAGKLRKCSRATKGL